MNEISRPSGTRSRLLACLPARLSFLASPMLLSSSLSPFLSPMISLAHIVALILCTWWSKSGNSSTRAFCQTDYGTSGVSFAPSRPIIRPVSSLVPLSLCLRVSVLIRHFVDIAYICVRRHAYVYPRVCARTYEIR